VSYLGHMIGPGTLSVSEKNTRALRTAKPPSTQTELRSFIDLCNVYRRFVSGFAKIAAPLNALIRKGESPKLCELSEAQLLAFETLREKSLNPPVLTLPKAEGQFTLYTDASSNQIGCCLYQDQPDGMKHPLGFWSRGLTSAEKTYSTTETECLAIAWAILHLRPYLEGRRFVVRTDHHSLRWVLNLADAQGRLARWRLRPQEFDFEVQYLPDRSHHGADLMSRIDSTDPTLRDTSSPVDTEIPCFAISQQEYLTLLSVDTLREHQRCDPQYLKLLSHWGWSDSFDLDENGIFGHVHPSGEFEVVIPETIPTGEPLAIVKDMELPSACDAISVVENSIELPGAYVSVPPRRDVLPEDEALTNSGESQDSIMVSGSYLWDEDVPVLRRGDTFSNFATDPVNPGAQALAVDDLPREISLEELRYEQERDPEISELFDPGGSGRNPVIDVNRDGIVIRKAPLDGAEQILVPLALHPRVLYLEHHPKSVGHPGVTKMFRSMRKHYFWRNM
jgi:RNase H-like domain found in reverse transcriptase/Integrase zinc binding domain